MSKPSAKPRAAQASLAARLGEKEETHGNTDRMRRVLIQSLRTASRWITAERKEGPPQKDTNQEERRVPLAWASWAEFRPYDREWWKERHVGEHEGRCIVSEPGVWQRQRGRKRILLLWFHLSLVIGWVRFKGWEPARVGGGQLILPRFVGAFVYPLH